MTQDRTPLTQDQALDMLAECFMADPGTLTPQTPRDAVPGWDSMGALMFIAELDTRFSLPLPAETSRAMKSVADALAYLRSHGVLAD